jgi:hypothetical protein
MIGMDERRDELHRLDRLAVLLEPREGPRKLPVLFDALVPGGEEAARERLDAYLTPSHPTTTVAHEPKNEKTPVNTGVLKYRYRDSKPASEE